MILTPGEILCGFKPVFQMTLCVSIPWDSHYTEALDSVGVGTKPGLARLWAIPARDDRDAYLGFSIPGEGQLTEKESETSRARQVT